MKPPNNYLDNKIVYLNDAISQSLWLLLCIYLFLRCLQLFGKEKAHKTNKTANLILTWIFILLLSFIYALSRTVNRIIIYLIIITTSHTQIFETIFYVTWTIMGITWYLYLLICGYFMKIKLEHTYRDRLFAKNEKFVSVSFIFFAISTLFNGISFTMVRPISYWYPQISTQFSMKIVAIATFQFCIFAIIYLSLVLTLFHLDLHKFLSLTIRNNRELSLRFNEKLKYYVIKQTNLISLIIFAAVIYAITGYLQSVVFNYGNVYVWFCYSWTFWFCSSLIGICGYLTFDSNDKYYKLFHKRCHSCCIRLCMICINKQQDIDEDEMLHFPIKRYDSMSIYIPTNDKNACNDADECEIIKSICKLLVEYDQYGDNILKQITSTGYQLCDILNHFNHMLLYHDSPSDFNKIYQELTKNYTHNQCKNCQTYLRHYNRRLNNTVYRHQESEEKKEEENGDILQRKHALLAILDKMHAFYYHSYDTFSRNNSNTRGMDEIERIQSIYKFSKSINDNDHHNKFNSAINADDVNDTQNSGNIFSFGERFEYECKIGEESKNPLLVTSRYNTIKSELTNNEICNISMDIYNIEYEKCQQYMKMNYIKILQNRFSNKELIISHILSLLIYCNCDMYQYKWSQTYRRIIANENNENDISLINRHSYFYHSSKYLRELVEYFGDHLANKESKQFYHGVREILYFTRTTAQFNGPLSTSDEMMVAFNFTHNNGILLQIQYTFSAYPLSSRYFNCTYFSDYVNERECLFIGGIPMMVITNIINVSNGEIYKKYINALNIINGIMNGTYNISDNYDNDAINLCCELLLHQLTSHDNGNDNDNDEETNKFPQYVVNLLNEYCDNLKFIMVFWDIFIKIEQFNKLFVKNEHFFDMELLLRLFPNIEQIEYVNRSLPQLSKKRIIKNIIDYIVESEDVMNIGNLKYVLIHHTISTSIIASYDINNNNDILWSLQQDSEKIILRNKKINYQDTLSVHFTEINQGFASKNMMNHLLSLS